MRRWIPAVSNEAGLALPLAFFALVILSTILLAFLSVALMEPQMSQANTESAAALQLANACVDLAYDELAGSQPWGGYLAGATVERPWRDLIAWRTMPGLTSDFGECAAWIRNDIFDPDDRRMTGLERVDPRATRDENATVLLRASGRIHGVSRTLVFVVSAAYLPDPQCALCFTGPRARTDLQWTSHAHEDGWPYNHRTGAPTIGATKYAILAPNDERSRDIIADLIRRYPPEDAVCAYFEVPEPCPGIEGHHAMEVDGLSAVTGRPLVRWSNPGQGSQGVQIWPNIPERLRITPQIIQKFIEDAKVNADVTYEVPRDPRDRRSTLTDVGRICRSDWRSQMCWGTDLRPKIVYLHGRRSDRSDPDAYTLTFDGEFTVYGLVIAEGVNLAFKGDVRAGKHNRLYGLTIVSGENVRVDWLQHTEGLSYGALVINDNGSPEAPNPNFSTAANTHDAPDLVDQLGRAPIVLLQADPEWQFHGTYSSPTALEMTFRMRNLVRTRSYREEIAP